MLTRSRSAVSTVKTPAEVVNVTRPDHSLNRPGSPGPLLQMSVVLTCKVACAFEATTMGETFVAWVLANPTSPVLADITMISWAAAASIDNEALPACASTRISTGTGTLTESSGQTATRFANRAPESAADTSDPRRVARTTPPAAAAAPAMMYG